MLNKIMKDRRRRIHEAAKRILGENGGEMPKKRLAEMITEEVRTRGKSKEDTRLSVLMEIGDISWLTRFRADGRSMVKLAN